ncbi:hypothetical protein PHMEG_00026763 [Phytophthora megakarya]|uniref:Uncharacterized protein n=1 Tax=Phytophthora megakarya TaxID=4795 RepID=A0A225VA04_9STRA|nr:hypothetical protein PHMEG_00026763 [Phytophthora megakarya]
MDITLLEPMIKVCLKRHIKAIRGMNIKHLDGYIDEFMWRSWISRREPRQVNTCAGWCRQEPKDD